LGGRGEEGKGGREDEGKRGRDEEWKRDRFWRGFGRPKNRFSHLFHYKSKTKKHDVMEDPKEPSRKKENCFQGP
jgi:hypothetical protein